MIRLISNYLNRFYGYRMATAQGSAIPWRRHRFRSKAWILYALGALLLLLLIARLMLPSYVQRYVNRVLDRNPSYGGKVGTVHLHLWRGAYAIEDVSIIKTTEKIPVPLFAAARVEFSVDWRALFRATVVGKVTVYDGSLNFARNKQGEVQTGEEGNWVQTVRDLFPLRIDRFTVQDSKIRYQDFAQSPPVTVTLSEVNGHATNLTNSLALSGSLVAYITAQAIAEGHAPILARGSVNPYTKRANFDLALELNGLDLRRLNDVLKAYAGVDAERGIFSSFLEISCKDDRFDGYAKFLLRDVHLLSLEKDISNPLRLAWQAVVAAIAEVFTNQTQDQIATRVPISGKFGDADTDNLTAFFSLLGNAFIEAIKPGLDKESRVFE